MVSLVFCIFSQNLVSIVNAFQKSCGSIKAVCSPSLYKGVFSLIHCQITLTTLGLFEFHSKCSTAGHLTPHETHYKLCYWVSDLKSWSANYFIIIIFEQNMLRQQTKVHIQPPSLEMRKKDQEILIAQKNWVFSRLSGIMWREAFVFFVLPLLVFKTSCFVKTPPHLLSELERRRCAHPTELGRPSFLSKLNMNL